MTQSIPLRSYHLPEFCRIFRDVMSQRHGSDDGDENKSNTEEEEERKWRTKITTEFLIETIKVNNDHLTEWLLSLDCPIDLASIVDFCVDTNRLQMARLFVKNATEAIDEKLFATCAAIGDIDLLKSLGEDLYTPFAGVKAAKKGHIHVLKWFDENKFYPRNCSKIFEVACEEGYFDIVKYAFEKKYVVPSSPGRSTITYLDEETKYCRAAARGGHLEILKFLRKNKFAWDHSNVALEACKNGDLGVFKFVNKDNTIFIDEDWLRAAIKKNHLELVKYMTETTVKFVGPSTIVNATTWAAEAGHLEMLKYLHESGYPWDQDVCAYAASEGHIDCLKYAHEQGCRMTVSTAANALSYGHYECLKYAVENDCCYVEGSSVDIDNDNITEDEHLAILTFAHENMNPKFNWSTMECAIELGHVRCVQFLIESVEVPYDLKSCKRQVQRSKKGRGGRSEILRYLNTL